MKISIIQKKEEKSERKNEDGGFFSLFSKEREKRKE